jgi:hypothetical protein
MITECKNVGKFFYSKRWTRKPRRFYANTRQDTKKVRPGEGTYGYTAKTAAALRYHTNS